MFKAEISPEEIYGIPETTSRRIPAKEYWNNSWKKNLKAPIEDFLPNIFEGIRVETLAEISGGKQSVDFFLFLEQYHEEFVEKSRRISTRIPRKVLREKP